MKYFGTDGIRGKAYQELTLDFSYQLGLALNEYQKEVVIGIDTRCSSLDLAKALILGLKEKYFFAGVVPTSAILNYSLNHKMLGVMITASHNPYEDNGFKIINNGEKISVEEQQQIESKLHEYSQLKYQLENIDLSLDKAILTEYLSLLEKHFFKSKYKILYDAANGCFSDILPYFINQNDIINNHPNGLNINDNCGSTNPSQLILEVKKREYDLGISFDGDGDRLIIVDSQNLIYEGDFLTLLIAFDLKQRKLLLNNLVVLSELTNPGILKSLEVNQINYLITPVGDVNISKTLKNGYSLGGEPSGHIINQTVCQFGDGLLNAFTILRIIEEKSLQQYYQETTLFYHRNINLKINYPFKLNYLKVRKLKKRYTNNTTYIVIRKSGTEKVIRIDLFTQDNNPNKILNILLKGVKKCIKKSY